MALWGECLKSLLRRGGPRRHGARERWDTSVSLHHVPFLGHFVQQGGCEGLIQLCSAVRGALGRAECR